MTITWDENKRDENLREHGIDFAEVDGVFVDDYAITVEDRDHDEERFVTLGMDALMRLLVLVYTYRGDDEIRVISARKAERPEQHTYFKRRR